MLDTLQKLLLESRESALKIAVALLIFAITVVGIRLFKRYLYSAANKHHIAEQRTHGIAKMGQTLAYVVAIALISNVFGFGIQGIFVATSSFFALVGIAFFANWSILSNVTASVLIYFTFPFRIGHRVVVENEPRYSGILKDVTLFYLKIQTDQGSTITVPANIAIQKIITIQSPADWQAMQEEALASRERLQALEALAGKRS